MFRFISLLLPLIIAFPALGAFKIEDDAGEIEVSGRVQAGYNYRFLQDDDEDQSKNRVRFKQARFGVKGDLYDDYTIDLEFDLVGHGGYPKPTSIWTEWRPNSRFSARIGQFKTPLSAHRLVSGRDLLFINRPRVADDLVPGRDIGAQIDLKLKLGEAGRVVAQLGAFNHQGANTTEDDAKGTPLLIGRLELSPWGALKGGEGGVGPRRLALRLGLSAGWSDDASGGGADEPLLDPLHSINGQKAIYSADLALKVAGLFFSAELTSARYAPDEGAAYFAAGYLVQLSYYIQAIHLEPALRFDDLNPSDAVAGDRERTLTMGLNLYPNGRHELKMMLDYTHHLADGGDEAWREDEVMLLCQLAFR
ncbi:OprO/OprP family phosphate-selective porin [Myxococcota bacterium]|nr:OprO/OprP family phosphate-selective porin [Myxococcota bacterium]MBU1433216.1 OprO/OprP family phosphate-selective porin [Myxococcota bacterium]MBU1896334.1 OprO/OprP family phosphate-selective porin [Myxococcota bacterium]